MRIGTAIIRFRWLVLVGWIALAGVLVWLSAGRGLENEIHNFLPPDAPHSQALSALRRDFPDNSGLSQTVLVFERPDGVLTGTDLAAIEAVASTLDEPSDKASADELAGMSIRTPSDLDLRNPLTGRQVGPNPMVSRDGQAALVVVDIPANFISLQAYHVVDHVALRVRQANLPDGLNVAITGSSGFGHDYAQAATESHSRTTYVTLAAVICILLLVYRSPVAAMVPLVAISLAALVATSILKLGQPLGLYYSTAEEIFVFVLIYGAGIDYSLLFISRFREWQEAGHDSSHAVSLGLAGTFPAILASAITDTLGLLMLCFADFKLFQTTGPAVAIALLVALSAAVTLVPAMVAMTGKKLFWPTHHLGRIGKQRFWPGVARRVTRRPGLVLVVTLILLAGPALSGMGVEWNFDPLEGLPAEINDGVGNSKAGIDIVEDHWPRGELAPVIVLLESDRPLTAPQWTAVSAAVTQAVDDVEGIEDVRSYSQPLGENVPGTTNLLIRVLGAPLLRQEFLSHPKPADGPTPAPQTGAPAFRSARLQVIMSVPSLSTEAMDSMDEIRAAAKQSASQAGFDGNVHLAGITAEIIDIHRVTQKDFIRVAGLILGMIFVVIVILLRDPLLSAFMVLSTVLSYLVTLGVTAFVFTQLLGSAGLDWKVRIFVLVVTVAVGVDYNIFLAARLAQEARHHSPREAVRRAMASTGPVISSCGVIMAATLGSLIVGKVALLTQLGFAFLVGMLNDTFVIRPLLLPAFAALTGRTGRATSLARTDGPDDVPAAGADPQAEPVGERAE